ncbi:N-acetyl-1-D-myo-inositol-2-amino-2-deoxy-alpha-D-glucopyranoside deacetylase [Arthrobacter sp. CAN_A6]
MSRWEGMGAALVGGLLSAVLGTALHGHVIHVGDAALPVGAVAALLLTGAVLVWCGLWARNIIAAALCGGTAYVVVAALSSSSETLILTGTGGGPALPAAVAGNLWLFGLALASVLGVAVCAVVLRKSASAARTRVG